MSVHVELQGLRAHFKTFVPLSHCFRDTPTNECGTTVLRRDTNPRHLLQGSCLLAPLHQIEGPPSLINRDCQQP